MRFRSRSVGGTRVVAVTGVNTVSFAVLAGPQTRAGLLGFSVERIDRASDERYFMGGFKVFESVIPHPDASTQVSTFDHPVQSFVWDDFTARPGQEYEYLFHPVKGRPRKLEHRRPVPLTVRTEPLESATGHDVFFNRGVASSQAYVRRFGPTPIDQLEPASRRDAALRWLSRDLGDAIVRFVDACEPGDRLLGCFYEFRHRPAATALRAALDRGVDVGLIVDAKLNGPGRPDGTVGPSFPRQDNLSMLASAGIPEANVVRREARPSDIQHNKFMVRLAGGDRPIAVWTGSTNLSPGGISGQTNVGHWARDPEAAARFAEYWELLAGDPGGRTADTAAEGRARNRAFRAEVERLSPVPAELGDVAPGVTVAFSPRSSGDLLSAYARLLDSAREQACVTLAFGISDVFKDLLKDNTPQDHLVFLLLEKKDRPGARGSTAFVGVNASNNVYQAWGSFIRDPVYQWARETNAGLLGLNRHVSYVHSKFMLVDPLSADPIVVTGSANFSTASTRSNDENMLIIRGDRRVADIYLTEFNRLFNHYYFRSVLEDRRRQRDGPSLFLAETPVWQDKYLPGTLRAKRLELFRTMAPTQTL